MLLIAVGLMALFVLLLIAHGTVAKNRWGINSSPVTCPRCNSPIGSVRVPSSLREVLWGGVTCRKCGCVLDKWGREMPS
jgi:hypothetical protein